MGAASEDGALLRDAKFFMGSDVLLDPSTRSTRNRISLDERELKKRSTTVTEEEHTVKRKPGRPFGSTLNSKKKLKLTLKAASDSLNNVPRFPIISTPNSSRNIISNSPWSMLELINLKRIVTEFDAIGFERDWDTIAFELKSGRTVIEVKEKWNLYKGSDREVEKVPEKESPPRPTLQPKAFHVRAIIPTVTSVDTTSKVATPSTISSPRRATTSASAHVLSTSLPSHTPNTSFRPFTSSASYSIPTLNPVILTLKSRPSAANGSSSSSSSSSSPKALSLKGGSVFKKPVKASSPEANLNKKNSVLEDWDF